MKERREAIGRLFQETGAVLLKPLTYVRQVHENFLREDSTKARQVIITETASLLTPPAICLLGFIFRNELVTFSGFVLTATEILGIVSTYYRLQLDQPWLEQP